MDLVALYKCLSEPTRLRILNLLREGPLCVCQLQQALGESQVKMSKHLGYMKQRELLISKRMANWNYYEINKIAHPILNANLEALGKFAPYDTELSTDLKRLEEVKEQANCA